MWNPFRRPTETRFNNRAPRSDQSVPVSEATVDDWLAASVRPTDRLFDEMDAVMSECAITRPMTVWQMRRDLRWLRREAHKRGLEWGAP